MVADSQVDVYTETLYKQRTVPTLDAEIMGVMTAPTGEPPPQIDAGRARLGRIVTKPVPEPPADHHNLHAATMRPIPG